MVTNLHITDEHLTGPVPQQTCLFKNLKELDLDGGNLTGTIPEFLTTCFPYLNELDLSYNQVSHAHVLHKQLSRFSHSSASWKIKLQLLGLPVVEKPYSADTLGWTDMHKLS